MRGRQLVLLARVVFMVFGGVERFLNFPMIAPRRLALKKYFADFCKSRKTMQLALKYFPVDTLQTDKFGPMFFPRGTL